MSKSTIQYPETVVIIVTTHGEIRLDDTGKPKTFILPEGMKLTKLSAVVPGVCNYMTSDESDDYVETIISWLKRLDQKKITINGAQQNLVTTMAGVFQKEDSTRTLPDVEKDLREKKRQRNQINKPQQLENENNDENISESDEYEDQDDDEEDIKHSENYVYHSDVQYPSSTYENERYKTRSVVKKPINNTVINKTYIRKNATEQFESPWDFKISVLNVIGYPDLLVEMVGRHYIEESEVTLKQITQYLYNRGVREIILVDFSCSVFINESDVKTEPDARTERILRRELLKQGIHGGLLRKRRTIKKTLKNKNKKQMISKRHGKKTRKQMKTKRHGKKNRKNTKSNK
jgi:hypothetical protein